MIASARGSIERWFGAGTSAALRTGFNYVTIDAAVRVRVRQLVLPRRTHRRRSSLASEPPEMASGRAA